MELNDAGELIFQTYYMVDWSRMQQTNSEQTCISCERRMKKAGPARDKKGLVYDGFVCHSCKVVFWLKRT